MKGKCKYRKVDHDCSLPDKSGYICSEETYETCDCYEEEES